MGACKRRVIAQARLRGRTSTVAGADNTIVKPKGNKAAVGFVMDAKSSRIADIVLLAALARWRLVGLSCLG